METTQPIQATPQQLFDQGDYRGAADVLLERVESDLLDVDRA